MRNTLLVLTSLIILAGCGPQPKPIQNEFLLKVKQSKDIKLARINEEIDIADGMMFVLDEAKIVPYIPNLDPNSPFDRILSKTNSFLVCKATIWKTKPEAIFPKYDNISVVPSFGTLISDQFIIKHAEMAYGKPIFDQSKITLNKQQFIFVYEIRYDEPGWSFHFYKGEGNKMEIYRMIDSGT
jgi:hypothetical protein